MHDFEDLSSQVANLDDENLECIFMNGLKLEVQDLVLILKSVGFNAVIEATVRVEALVICIIVESTINQNIRNPRQYMSAQSRGNMQQNTWKVRTISNDITPTSSSVIITLQTTRIIPIRVILDKEVEENFLMQSLKIKERKACVSDVMKNILWITIAKRRNYKFLQCLMGVRLRLWRMINRLL